MLSKMSSFSQKNDKAWKERGKYSAKNRVNTHFKKEEEKETPVRETGVWFIRF